MVILLKLLSEIIVMPTLKEPEGTLICMSNLFFGDFILPRSASQPAAADENALFNACWRLYRLLSAENFSVAGLLKLLRLLQVAELLCEMRIKVPLLFQLKVNCKLFVDRKDVSKRCEEIENLPFFFTLLFKSSELQLCVA